MLSKMEFTPNANAQSTAVLAFDIGTVVTNMLPVTDISFEYNRDSVRRPKMEMVGTWNGFQKINEILIHMLFDIIGNDSSDFNTKKFLINSALSPANPSIAATLEPLGTLKLRFDGATEDVQAPVTIDGDVSIPWVGPQYSNAQITWVIGQGYMTGVTTPANIYYPK